MLLKEHEQEATKRDPFTTLQQEKGDIVYFGIHDLARQYKQNGSLPVLNMNKIEDKKGVITDADPIDQVVDVAVSKAPFHYGYRKLENDKDKSKRFMRDDGQMEVKISVSNLQDISHLVEDLEGKVWLVIDGNTTYQKGLMREIRRKEVERAHASEEPSHPKTRHYDDYEGEEFSVDEPEDDDVDYMYVAHFDPNITSKGFGWKHFNETRNYKKFC